MSRLRVVIADDQPMMRAGFKAVLEATGNIEVVAEAGTGEEAVHAATQYAPDVVLMDLNYSRDTTSGAEGLQLLADVRTADPMLPIVVMTGWGHVDLAVEAMRAGARSFIQKPWDNAALVQILEREVADGRGARQRATRAGVARGRGGVRVGR